MHASPEDITKANIDYYDKHADSYEQDEELMFEEHAKFIRKTLFRIKSKSSAKRLLDVGCGSGNILRFAKDIFEDVWGVDINQKMLSLSKRYTENLVKSNINKMPFEDSSYDLLTYYSVLHHLHSDDIDKTLKEAYRILKHGGMLYTDNDPNSLNISRSLYGLFNTQKDEGVSDEMKLAEYHRFFSKGLNPKILRSLLKSIGFREVEIIYRLTATRPRNWLLAPLYYIRTLVEMLIPSRMCLNFAIIARK